MPKDKTTSRSDRSHPYRPPRGRGGGRGGARGRGGRPHPGLARKHEAIRRAKVKKEYHKMLEKEGDMLLKKPIDVEDAPTDEEVVEKSVGKKAVHIASAPIPDGTKQETILDQDDLTTSHEATEDTQKQLKGKQNKLSKSHHKPNPYAKLLSLAETRKAERQAAIAEARRLKEEQNQKRKEYYAARNDTRSKLNRKTSKGQPVMKNQIEHLLGRLMKDGGGKR